MLRKIVLLIALFSGIVFGNDALPTIYNQKTFEAEGNKYKGCSVIDLNTNLEEKMVTYSGTDIFGDALGEGKQIRINPIPNEACSKLINSPYEAKKPEYTCKKEWYKEEEWEEGLDFLGSATYYEGITLPEIEEIRKKVPKFNLQALVKENGEKTKIRTTIEKELELFGIKGRPNARYMNVSEKPINKECWIWKQWEQDESSNNKTSGFAEKINQSIDVEKQILSVQKNINLELISNIAMKANLLKKTDENYTRLNIEKNLTAIYMEAIREDTK